MDLGEPTDKCDQMLTASNDAPALFPLGDTIVHWVVKDASNNMPPPPNDEQLVKQMLKRPWIVETDPNKADFIIATERSHCADNQRVVLIDEVKRFDRTFAWVYARRAGDL